VSRRRTLRLLTTASAALTLFAAGPSSASAACAGADLEPSAGNVDQVAQATLCLVNEERTSRGLGSLTENSLLSRAARGHSTDMVDRNYFAHDSLGGSSFVDRIRSVGYLPSSGSWVAGENIAYGTSVLGTPRAIVKSWMESPGHRANILNRSFRELGIGVAPGVPVAGRDSGGTYTHDFGYRSGTTARKTSCARLARKARTARTASARKKARRAARRCRARR
jgi:uncharacterized protein YkwD